MSLQRFNLNNVSSDQFQISGLLEIWITPDICSFFFFYIIMKILWCCFAPEMFSGLRNFTRLSINMLVSRTFSWITLRCDMSGMQQLIEFTFNLTVLELWRFSSGVSVRHVHIDNGCTWRKVKQIDQRQTGAVSKRLLQFWLTGGGSQGFKLCVGVSLQSVGVSLQSVGVSLQSVGVSLQTCGLWVSESRATFRSLTHPAFMWVAQARWAQVWVVAKLSEEGTQYLTAGGWWGTSWSTSSVQRRSLQFDIDGFLYSSFCSVLLWSSSNVMWR